MSGTKPMSLAHIEAQNRGEKQNIEQEYFPQKTNETPTPAPESEYVIFKLVNRNGRGNVNIDGVCDVIHPDTGKIERMRLLSGVPSVWIKDQKDITKEYVDMNRRSLRFEGHVCRILKNDETAIYFAQHHNGFVENPKRKTGSKNEFFEWNPQRIAEERLKQKKYKFEAMQKAMECPEAEMKKHAIYLGVLPVDEMGFPKQPDLLRHEYISKAEENPSKFMESFGSKVVEISFMVRRAIMEAKIDFGKERNKAYFSHGKFICSLPPNRKPIEVLLELATSTTPEAKEFIEDLQRAVQ